MKHQTLEELKTSYTNMIEINNRLMGLSLSRNESDDIKIITNTFFDLFCYEQFKLEIFKTGWETHYENKLIQDGFVLSTIGNNEKYPKNEIKYIKHY